MTRILTIAAAAIAVTAIGFTAPASATSLGAAGQTIAQSVDSPILEVGKKWGKRGKHRRHGKWHGGGRKWHGGGRRHGYYPRHRGYHYGGCYQQVQLNIAGHYVWQTINVC